MAFLAIPQSTFSGGWSTDPRLGIANSQPFTQALDFRKSPSQLTVLPGLLREDTGEIKDLILNEVMAGNGVCYALGDQGYVYKRSTAGLWSAEAKQSSGAAGIDYRKDTDSIYTAGLSAVSLLSPIVNPTTSSPTSFVPDKYAESASTYNNSAIVGFNVNANQIGSGLTTSILIASNPLSEASTAVRFFQTDIEPLSKIQVFIPSGGKGTGNWTMTVHDGLEKVLSTATVSNANLKNNAWNDFALGAPGGGQVRVYPAPNARTYHIHLTSTVADGFVASSATNDLSTMDLILYAARFVIPNNGLHPIQRFQQYECFAPGTKVVTEDGVYDIETLTGQTKRVLTPEGYKDAKFSSYGVKRLWEVEFATGEKVLTTKKHQWIVQSAGKTIKVYTPELEGRKVPRSVAESPELNEDFYEGLKHGIVYGDGTKFWNTTRVLLYGQKQELAQFFDQEKVTKHFENKYTGVYGLPGNWKELPTDVSKSYWYGFTAGMIATDGCVDKRDGCITIAQKQRESLDEIRKRLPWLGMVGGLVNNTEQVLNGERFKCHVLNLRKNFVNKNILVRSDQLEIFKKHLNDQSRYGLWASIKKVTQLDEYSDVYCCQEPETSSFTIDNGILTGNCFGNSNYLSVWEPISDPPTNDEWRRHALVFPEEYEVCSLTIQNEFLLIGCDKNTTLNTSNPQEGIIFFWDGLSPTYNYFVKITAGSPQALFTNEDNIACYYASGDWYGISSVNTTPVKLRNMPGSDTQFSSPSIASQPINVYPYAATMRNGVMLMGWPGNTTNTNINFGVYSWGSIDKNLPDTFGYNYIISTGSQKYTTSNNLQIGMVKNFGNLLQVSWRDDLNGGYGIDAINNSSIPAPYAKWQGLIYDGKYAAKLKAAQYIECYYYIPSNVTITLGYSIDGGAFVVDSNSYSTSNLWQGTPNYCRFDITDSNGGRFHEIQPQLEIRSTNSSSEVPAQIQMIGIVVNNNAEEPIQ